MSKPEPSMDEWLAEGKASENADLCGMFLAHNGIVRATAKAQVREGVQKPAVAQVDFSYDAEGVEAAISKAGNSDVYADVKFKQNVHVYVYNCMPEQLDERYENLLRTFAGDESYN